MGRDGSPSRSLDLPAQRHWPRNAAWARLLFPGLPLECRLSFRDTPMASKQWSNEDSATAMFMPAASARLGVNGSWRQSSGGPTGSCTRNSSAPRI
jgi:hypothetical protein